MSTEFEIACITSEINSCKRRLNEVNEDIREIEGKTSPTIARGLTPSLYEEQRNLRREIRELESKRDLVELVGNNPNAEDLTNRGYAFLQDSDWWNASKHFDGALYVDSERVSAYVGRLCAELEVTRESELVNQNKLLSDNPNFKKAVRFADENYRSTLEGYNSIIKERLEEQKKQRQYNDLLEKKRKASTEDDYKTLAKEFRSMNGYKDAAVLADECDEQQYNCLLEKKRKASTEDGYKTLAEKFRGMGGYKDTRVLAAECDEQYEKLKKQREEDERRWAQELRKERKIRSILTKLHLFVTIGGAVAFFGVLFFTSIIRNHVLSYASISDNGFWSSMFNVTLPFGVIFVLYGIFSRLLTNRDDWGDEDFMALLFFIVWVAYSVYVANIAYKGLFLPFPLYLILILVANIIAAIPGGIIAGAFSDKR